MTPGQMLLMGFAGMFSRLDADFAALLDTVSSLQTIDVYKKADLVREAAMLQVIWSVNCSMYSDTNIWLVLSDSGSLSCLTSMLYHR